MRSSSPFEPGYANFARLCENISLNRCGDRVVPVPLRLADANGLPARVSLCRTCARAGVLAIASTNWSRCRVSGPARSPPNFRFECELARQVELESAIGI